jgi:hypothetical protein
MSNIILATVTRLEFCFNKVDKRFRPPEPASCTMSWLLSETRLAGQSDAENSGDPRHIRLGMPNIIQPIDCVLQVAQTLVSSTFRRRTFQPTNSRFYCCQRRYPTQPSIHTILVNIRSTDIDRCNKPTDTVAFALFQTFN